MVKHAGAHMTAQGRGSIVCTASVAGLRDSSRRRFARRRVFVLIFSTPSDRSVGNFSLPEKAD
jgi:NAD(P)-dependent dehydrogenase (short-subunit alcohol dehydrogenase family)